MRKHAFDELLNIINQQKTNGNKNITKKLLTISRALLENIGFYEFRKNKLNKNSKSIVHNGCYCNADKTEFMFFYQNNELY